MSSRTLKRKAEPAQDADTPSLKQLKVSGPASNLIPVGERTKAYKGKKDPDMLRMLCNDRVTGKRKELHFKKLVHAEIDWNNTDHIAKINSWRNQLYGRAGLKAKHVCMWNHREEAWLELYYHLIVVQGSKEGLMIPRAKDVLEDFNQFFMGKVFLSNAGEEMEPRGARQHNAFVSKMNRVVFHIKTRLEHMMIGKTGDFYRPIITEAMLDKYQELKADLEDSGIMGKTFTWEVDHEAGDEWAKSPQWIKFSEGLNNLPALVEQEATDLDADLDSVLEELEVDMNEPYVKVEGVSEDEGTLYASHSQTVHQAEAKADSKVGSDSGNDTTFTEGDTSITEPDHVADEAVKGKTTPTCISVLNFNTDMQTADQKTDSPQAQEANKTVQEANKTDSPPGTPQVSQAENVGSRQVDETATNKTALGAETDGEHTQTVNPIAHEIHADIDEAADALLALSTAS
jgi:hypothetical protein